MFACSVMPSFASVINSSSVMITFGELNLFSYFNSPANWANSHINVASMTLHNIFRGSCDFSFFSFFFFVISLLTLLLYEILIIKNFENYMYIV